MSKHTPGPWTIMNPYASGKMKFLVGADGQGFCHTVGLIEPQDSDNARLIAAAPDFLEACNELLKAEAMPCITINEMTAYDHKFMKAMYLIKQAIAKAEGKDHD